MNNLINIATTSGFVNTVSNSLSISDQIQLAIALITLLAVLVALFGERFWKWKEKPIIDASFNKDDPECYLLTDMHIIRNGVIIKSIPTYYIRLRVTNNGIRSLENTEVILKKVEPKPNNFMSLNLSWAGYNNSPNDITRTTRIPRGVTRIIDIIEVMEPSITKNFSDKLKAENDSDTPRYLAYSKGFRSCSIKPNTLSDIFKAGKYTFYLGIYADNSEPKVIKLSVNYDGRWGIKGIKEMHDKHLKVRIINS